LLLRLRFIICLALVGVGFVLGLYEYAH